MIAALRLLPLLLRRSGRSGMMGSALGAAGVAVAVAVGSILLVAQSGLAAREDRLGWREPVEVAERDATALARRSTEVVGGAMIDIVELEPLSTGAAARGVPVPPGLDRAPAPGQSVVSPALAELMRRLPADELADRFPPVVGTIGRAGLSTPDELVAVVGRAPGHLRQTEQIQVGFDASDRLPGDPSPVTAISAFSGRGTDRVLQQYLLLALVAVVLVVVPAVMLVGSSARLTAARREQRLAAMRLAGAGPAAVRALAAAETAIASTVGALGGLVLAAMAAPVLQHVPMAGGTWFTGDLTVSLSLAAKIVLVSVVVSTLAAVSSLRRVTASPLGVARSTEPRTARWPRLVGLAVSIAAMVIAGRRAEGGGSEVALIGALGAVMASLALVGPFITSLLARVMAWRARRPATLIAARRIRNDPGAAYRTVGAIVLAGLVAGFMSAVIPTASEFGQASASATELAVVLESEAAEEVERIVTDAGATVRRITLADGDLEQLMIEPGDVSVERLRTSTMEVRSGAILLAPRDDPWRSETVVNDLRRSVTFVLAATMLLAAAASTLAAAAAVLDQRRTLERLVRAGVDSSTLHRSRRWQLMLPLVASTVGSVGLGLFTGTTLMVGAGLPPDQVVTPGLLPLLGVVVASVVIGWVCTALTRPLLDSVTRLG